MAKTLIYTSIFLIKALQEGLGQEGHLKTSLQPMLILIKGIRK